MEHEGHRERLRKRYKREGLTGFAAHEVLELLLTYAIPRLDTNPIAHRLMDRFGSLHAVLEASPEELEQVQGVGPQASTLLTLLLPVMRMYEQEKLLPRPQLNTYAELAAYCRTLFLGAGNEKMYLLCLDAKLKLLATVLIANGTPTEVNVLPRMVVAELIRRNAVGAVITHNHPSGSAEPSAEDLELTFAIQSILRSVDIRLYDHVLIAGNQDFSFFANRLLEGEHGMDAAAEEDFARVADRPQRQLPARGRRK